MSEENLNLLEAVAKASAFCHYARQVRSPKMPRIEELAEKHWRDFEHDARMIIEVINKLVLAQQFSEQVEALPMLPAFLSEAVN